MEVLAFFPSSLKGRDLVIKRYASFPLISLSLITRLDKHSSL